MNRSILLVALATASSFAGTVRIGADALVGYDILEIGSDLDQSSNPSYGAVFGPTLAFGLNEMVSLQGGVAVLYDFQETEQTYLGQTFTRTQSKTALAFQVTPVYHITDMVSIKAGYEWDMPLTGTEKSEVLGVSVSNDVVAAPDDESDLQNGLGFPTKTGVVSIHNLVLGASFGILPNLAVSVQGKYALNGDRPDYDGAGKLQGSASKASNVAAHQIAVGLSYGVQL